MSTAYYQREEIAAAIALARTNAHTHRVVPVYLPGALPSSDRVPYGLRLKHGISLRGDSDFESAARRLLDLLTTLGGHSTRIESHVDEQPSDPHRYQEIGELIDRFFQPISARLRRDTVIWEGIKRDKDRPYDLKYRMAYDSNLSKSYQITRRL